MIRQYHFINTTHSLEVVLADVAQANLSEEVFLPALDTAVNTHGDVSLLADGTAEATSLTSCSHVGESISQVVELALVEQFFGHVVLEPENLGDLHFNAHLSTDISEEVVVGGIDLLGLLNRPVVEPEDDIAVVAVLIVEFGARDTDRLVGLGVEDGQRAGSIKANAADGVGVDVVLRHGSLDGGADASPDVGGGLLVVSRLGLPQTNVLTGQTDNVALVVHDAGSGTTRTDINANVMVLLNVELIVRVDGHLSRLLAVGVAEWHGAILTRHDCGVGG